MPDTGREPEKKSNNNWWLAGAALALGYYIGHADTPVESNPSYAEVEQVALAPADDSLVEASSQDEEAEVLQTSEEVSSEPPAQVEDAVATDEAADTATEYAYYVPPQAASDVSADTDAQEAADEALMAKRVALATGTAATSATGPRTSYGSTRSSTLNPPANVGATYQPRATYVPPVTSYPAPKCESLGCYGAISTTTGLPRTTYVSGYYRKDGTYVRPYYRSRRR